MEKRNINRFLIPLLFLLSFALVIFSLYLFFSKPLKTESFDVIFTVKEGLIGFDVNTTALTFGTVNPGGSGKRDVTIKNEYDFPVAVKVYVSDNLKKLINVQSKFEVLEGKNETIAVRLKIPQDYAPGEYKGKIEFRIYKARIK